MHKTLCDKATKAVIETPAVNDVKTAQISQFKSLGSSILYGDLLTEVKQIERSIVQFGLITPLIVTKSPQGLVILDGKKRFAAIKRMRFSDSLPRSLTRIPYIFAQHAGENTISTASILSNQDVFEAVEGLKSAGHTTDEIADKLYLCRSIIMDFIQLMHLSPYLKTALFRNIISFKQALAYSTLPDDDSQILWLKRLGPFANPKTIITAIAGAHSVNEASLAENSIIAFMNRNSPHSKFTTPVPMAYGNRKIESPASWTNKAA